jgi:hypothetical protein
MNKNILILLLGIFIGLSISYFLCSSPIKNVELSHPASW